jgi:hypothetical protein
MRTERLALPSWGKPVTTAESVASTEPKEYVATTQDPFAEAERSAANPPRTQAHTSAFDRFTRYLEQRARKDIDQPEMTNHHFLLRMSSRRRETRPVHTEERAVDLCPASYVGQRTFHIPGGGSLLQPVIVCPSPTMRSRAHYCAHDLIRTNPMVRSRTREWHIQNMNLKPDRDHRSRSDVKKRDHTEVRDALKACPAVQIRR